MANLSLVRLLLWLHMRVPQRSLTADAVGPPGRLAVGKTGKGITHRRKRMFRQVSVFPFPWD